MNGTHDDPRIRTRRLARVAVLASGALVLSGLGAVLSPWLLPKQGQIPVIIFPGAAVLVLGLLVGVVGVLLRAGARRREGQGSRV